MYTLATIGAMSVLADMRGHMDARRGQPVINVKCHVWVDSIPWDELRGEFGDRVDTVKDWAMALENDNRSNVIEDAWEWARESWWSDAHETACEHWGDTAKVYSAGRPGGWLYVDNVSDPESWTIETCQHIERGADACYDWECEGIEVPDVAMVERWEAFRREIAAMVEGFPYMVGWELVSAHDNAHDLAGII
jgi:hypothetical protein